MKKGPQLEFIAGMVLCAVLLAGCARPTRPPVSPGEPQRPSSTVPAAETLSVGVAAGADTPPEGVAEASRPESGLRPGDAVRVQVWLEPQLTGEYTVDQNGVIVFPLLGERRVLGISADSLEQRLIAEYRAYLESPSVDVTVLRRISILGEVRQPGLYPVDLTMNVTDVLALAGGLGPTADQKGILLVREGRTLQDRLEAGTPLAATPIRSGDQIVVTQRSWFSRNVGIVSAGIGAMTSVLVALLVR